MGKHKRANQEALLKKQRQTRRWIAAGVLAAVLVIVLIVLSLNREETQLTAHLNEEGDLVVLLDSITDQISLYSYEGIEEELLFVKASDNTYKAAFNLCQDCAASEKGYYVQNGTNLTCQACGITYPIEEIGLGPVEEGAGGELYYGCQPIPVPEEGQELTETELIISKEALLQQAEVIKSWK